MSESEYTYSVNKSNALGYEAKDPNWTKKSVNYLLSQDENALSYAISERGTPGATVELPKQTVEKIRLASRYNSPEVYLKAIQQKAKNEGKNVKYVIESDGNGNTKYKMVYL